MSRMHKCCQLGGLIAIVAFAGCANRQGWGFASGQGTIERQKARAVIHDPYPQNDIGPDVVGGRPREFYNPEAEPVRAKYSQQQQFPSSFGFPGQ